MKESVVDELRIQVNRSLKFQGIRSLIKDLPLDLSKVDPAVIHQQIIELDFIRVQCWNALHAPAVTFRPAAEVSDDPAAQLHRLRSLFSSVSMLLAQQLLQIPGTEQPVSLPGTQYLTEETTMPCLVARIADLYSSPSAVAHAAIRVVDIALIISGPEHGKIASALLDDAQSILANSVSDPDEPDVKRPKLSVCRNSGEDVLNRLSGGPRAVLLPVVNCPSFVEFNRDAFEARHPMHIRHAIDHWPARQRWLDWSYLRDKFGHRTVPIELGAYQAQEFALKLQKFSEFIASLQRADAAELPYLAQHRLFDQIPELRADICIPDYVHMLSSDEDIQLNAWIGPAGTVSTLHWDAPHNFLAQVRGRKYVRLHAPTDSTVLQRGDSESKLFNTSAIDIEHPSAAYEELKYVECVLMPGDMLYIPPRWWHYVRALDASASVSFWFQ